MKFYVKNMNEHSIAPSLFYLMTSHHPPCQLNRTWRFKVFGHCVFVCTRCLGQDLGIALALVSALVLNAQINSVPLAVFAFGVLPFPSTLDWSIQTIFARESRNPIRFATGFMFGFSVGLCIGQLVLGRLDVFGLALLIYASYIFVVMFLLWKLHILDAYLKPYEEFLDRS